MQFTKVLGSAGTVAGGFSGGVLSAGISGGEWGLGGSVSCDVTKPISKLFAFVNSKLPASAAPIEAPVEGLIISAIKSIS
jgi:hypothetical protein